ncbi:IS110 family transposase [Acidithiobacillus ferrooxidans]|jgi:transposase|uniref:IS110 family transposase n=1 Tax=Acidithiobacillus ferrooxidans TaxID=920 RepID=UPI0021486C7D|nr:IS110 family transposase [Acidithiobacillus ferrooxidans]MCR0968245.1 IS110 family transposase [Acidithiobacillus ferrooxidans]MCR1349799.1 IS110 family transposase [Acidithiobacillus ferrooxidans]MCR1351739.1 IS110 family transposase [Acidithiobacillus ferrooxidans]
MKEIKILGIDLAKNVFQLHGVDAAGKPALRKNVSRGKLMETLANFPRCLIGIEACGGAHYWAREISKLGHEVRIMAPQFVAPYRKSGKNDLNDAEAICEAVSRPHMRFVAVKTEAQQSALMVHRVRASINTERTALINQMRGLLQEFGFVIAKGASNFSKRFLEVLEKENLPLDAVEVLAELRGHLLTLEDRLAKYDRMIARMLKDEMVARVMTIPGVGPVTATAVVATVGDAKVFHNGREMAAYVGLVPRQNSSGGKTRLGRITKLGDSYLRSLFVQGALIVIRHLGDKKDTRSQWIRSLVERRGVKKAAVALAARMVRIAWALMARNEPYKPATS